MGQTNSCGTMLKSHLPNASIRHPRLMPITKASEVYNDIKMTNRDRTQVRCCKACRIKNAQHDLF